MNTCLPRLLRLWPSFSAPAFIDVSRHHASTAAARPCRAFCFALFLLGTFLLRIWFADCIRGRLLRCLGKVCVVEPPSLRVAQYMPRFVEKRGDLCCVGGWIPVRVIGRDAGAVDL